MADHGHKSPLSKATDLLIAQANMRRELPMEDGGPGAKAMNAELKLRQLFIDGARRMKKTT